MSSGLSCADYHVAWICPVADLELLPARLMLDEEHTTPPYDTHYDENTYICGSINNHAVVLATCPQGETGNVNAGRLTGSMFKTFPNIRMTVLVGIGGGIPRKKTSEDALDDIHLGDVVVGWPGDGGPACVYHGRGKSKVNEEFDMVGTIQNPDWRLTNALSILAADHEMGKTTFDVQLARLQRAKRAKKFTYPGIEHDKLFKAGYHHVGDGSNCNACDQSNLVQRPQRAEEDWHTITFHQGRIATGNAVIRDGELRDKIGARCGGALCVEMEAAGVDANRRCLVVRGISDYADSHKNDVWRLYAAGKAAAFTRELLCRIQPAMVREMEGVSEAPWLVPLPRPQSYVGRKDQLARLITHVHSEGCHRYAVYGLGGCGKTALALEAAYQMREQQPERAIFWVPAISLSAFEQAYREIGLLLRIPGITDTNADVKQLVRAKLSDEGFGQWLIIVDNADDDGVLFNLLTEGSGAARLIDYLPNSRKGSFIFTTRVAKAAHNLAGNNVIELGMLNKNEAKEVLRTRLFPKYQHQIEDEAAVDDFLGMLAFLALAIVQAAAFINQNDIQLFKYVQLYRASEQEATKLLSEEFQDQGRYRETKNPIATTWRISFEQIRERDRLAADHMSFMACTASNDIPESMLLVEESQVAQEKAIGVLKAYAFITEQELVGDEWQHQQEQTRISKRSFNVHPLVHLAIRGWLKAHNKWREWLETTMSRLELIVPLGDHETIREWTAYLPHAKHIVDMPEVYETEVRMGLLRRIGECEMMLGQYKAAEETLRLLVERKTHLFGEDDRRAMKYKENLAQTLLHQGRSAEAEQVARRMLKIRTQTLGEEHEVALISMNNVAVALSYQGQFAEAEQMHRRILVLRQKVLGKERPITLASMQNLAIALRKQDQHIEAEQILRETVELRKKVLGCEHPDTVKSTSSLARVLSALGRYEEAAQLCRETLVLRAKVLGEQHPRTQKSREHLAEVLENLGRYEEAVSIRNPRS